MRKRIFLFISIFFIQQTWCQRNILSNNVYELEIFQASSSGKSVIVNRGELEGLTLGETAHVFFKDDKKGVGKPKYYYVAEGEVIKLKDSKSYWYFKRIRRQFHIRTGKRLAFVMKGRDPRRPFNAKHVHKVVPRGKRLQQFKEEESEEVPMQLIFGDDQYLIDDNLVETELYRTDDITTDQAKNWKKHGAGEYDYRLKTSRAVLRSPRVMQPEKTELVKRNIEKGVFDSTALFSMSKVNAQKYGLEELYSESFVDGATETRKKSSDESIYDRFQSKQKEDNLVNPAATHLIKDRGALFSREMSDQELREFFINSGIERELARQKKSLEQSLDHEFVLVYSNNMTNHTSTEDPSYQGSNYAISLAYELYLLRTSERLRNYTFSIELERGVGNYDINTINGRFGFGSINAYVHYYFMNAPISLHKYMPFIGFGYKAGNADVFSPNLSKEYEFEYNTFPSVRAGVKYRFKAGDTSGEFVKLGFGASFVAQYDQYNYTNTSFLDDNIYSTFSTRELKVGIGLNIYF